MSTRHRSSAIAAASDDLGVVGELGEHVQRRDVLEHVDVRVPLEEAQLGALGDPLEDERLGPLEMFGAGETGDGEGLVGVALAGEVLDRPGDHDVVLRPEPQVVEAIVRAEDRPRRTDWRACARRWRRSRPATAASSGCRLARASIQCRSMNRKSRVSSQASIWSNTADSDSTVTFSIGHVKSGSRCARPR